MQTRPRLREGIPEPWAVEWGEDRYGLFMSFAVAGCLQKLRYIQPGRFLMGSPDGETGRFPDEGPQHVVELTQGFWLAATPCTQALWQAVVGANPSRQVGRHRPVEQVSWEDCQEFLDRLNQCVPGLKARLPTEAEWEYACRAGTREATWRGELDGEKSASVLDPIAWYRDNSGDGSKDVAGKAANPWGLYDMLGNVWEWCQDLYGVYDAKAGIDPMGPEVGPDRVARGGAWFSDARYVRAAYRSADAPALRFDYPGFRLARGQGPG